jgi:hypothetical protein
LPFGVGGGWLTRWRWQVVHALGWAASWGVWQLVHAVCFVLASTGLFLWQVVHAATSRNAVPRHAATPARQHSTHDAAG